MSAINQLRVASDFPEGWWGDLRACDAREVVEHIDAQAARITDLEQALRDALPELNHLYADHGWTQHHGSLPIRIQAILGGRSVPDLSWPSIAEGVQ